MMAARKSWQDGLLAAALLLSLLVSVGLLSAGAQGYWEDPFAAMPAWTWPCWVIAVALAWACLLASQRSYHHWLSAFVLGASVLQLTLVPRSKGMVLPEGGDPPTHIGVVVDLLRTHTLHENLYPGLHLWTGSYSLFTGLGPLEVFRDLYLPVLLGGMLLAAGLLAWTTVHQTQGSRAFGIGVGIAALPLSMTLKAFPIANGWATFLLPLAICAAIRMVDPETPLRGAWFGVAALLFATLAVGHPLMAPTVCFMVIGLAMTALVSRHPSFRPGRLGTALALVSLLAISLGGTAFFVLQTDFGQQLLEQANQASPPTNSTPLQNQIERATGYGFDAGDVARIFAVSHLPRALLAGAAVVGIAWLSLGPRSLRSMPISRLATVVGVTGILVLGIGISSLLLGDLGIRANRFLDYAPPFLLATAAVGIAGAGLWTRSSIVLPIVVVVAIATLGLGGAYKSPLVVAAWDPVQPSELVGASWFATYKTEKPVFIGQASGAHRYGAQFYGVAGVEEERPDLYRYTGSKIQWDTNYPKVPDHFDFSRIVFSCGAAATGKTGLLFLPVGDLEPYVEGAYKVTERFSPADVRQWAGPAGGARIYDSGPRHVQVYATPAC